MKKLSFFLVLALLWDGSNVGSAETTINSTNKFAYGANIGWVNWQGDVANGAVITDYVCSGFIYSANVGWIHLGSGNPQNGIRYQNNSEKDFGVNHDGAGILNGFAYGANVGWINFEESGEPKVDLHTGRLSGSVYSANCGWISLSNAVAFVQTDSIREGSDKDLDGIADAWEWLNFSSLTNANASSDFDGDGASDLAEYNADTEPKSEKDFLRILSLTTEFKNELDFDTLSWTSRPNRKYRVHYRNGLEAVTPWVDSGFLFNPSLEASTTGQITFDAPSLQRFFQVEAVRPLP